ncbi:MAG: excinuclease ABC subunit UvrB [Candidatus Margulisbacteria bacterium]|nr:excinuclease ABC subunit UvrB [Candidatus Margulisiibacteriota bacterium]
MQEFILESNYQPTGDQPQAIKELVDGINQGKRFQTLRGVTGSGKTFTVANIIAQINKPAIILAHNKTLAAQLCSEFREYFPKNSVEFFISYYDYYQPEAYLPTTDTYIEKDSSINEEIEKMRHSATFSLFNRKDVLIVSSVSCIYGLGSPETYAQGSITLKKGALIDRDDLIEKLMEIRYDRNDTELKRGNFSVKGELIEIFPSYGDNILRVELFGEEIHKIYLIDNYNKTPLTFFEEFMVYPASHFLVAPDFQRSVIVAIQEDLQIRLQELKKENKLLEAQRLEQRTMYDIEMIEEVGYCSGIENYSRYLTDRKPGEAPYTLLDYFPKDFLLIVDESHVTLPQVRGMYAGDRSRKQTLVDYGFRLPSALDNRPLNFPEFEEKMQQVLFISATPGPYELSNSTHIAEQMIRPTGLIDPEIEVMTTKGQMDEILKQIQLRIDKKERTLLITLTKKMAEELTNYLLNKKVKARYMHSDIDTLERYEILHDLRAGEFDVLVGINLLREGLDLPEVSLIAILDADKEGFLRDERSLIQIIGRAARNVNGKVLLFADKMTGSMQRAISETNRRRAIQSKYNEDNNITPTTIASRIKEKLGDSASKKHSMKYGDKKNYEDMKWLDTIEVEKLTPKEFLKTIDVLRKEMRKAAQDYEFEKAAILRDKIYAMEHKTFS